MTVQGLVRSYFNKKTGTFFKDLFKSCKDLYYKILPQHTLISKQIFYTKSCMILLLQE